MRVGISEKPSSLHNPDKRGGGIDPRIEYFSFALEKQLKKRWNL